MRADAREYGSDFRFAPVAASATASSPRNLAFLPGRNGQRNRHQPVGLSSVSNCKLRPLMRGEVASSFFSSARGRRDRKSQLIQERRAILPLSITESVGAFTILRRASYQLMEEFTPRPAATRCNISRSSFATLPSAMAISDKNSITLALLS